MTSPSPGTLIDLETARTMLLDGVEPVVPLDLPLERALGAVAAEAGATKAQWPGHDEAATDGWACRARELSGASPYSPLVPARTPAWVEAGEEMPAGCDCIVDAEWVDATGPLVQIFAEAIPGQGVRRAGEDVPAGVAPAREGFRIAAADVLLARRTGMTTLRGRRPRVRVINVAADDGRRHTSQFVADLASAEGARVEIAATRARDADAIAAALTTAPCDLVLLVGGTGRGRRDDAPAAIARCGTLMAHGIAMAPGESTALGRLGKTPVIALPGLPDQAFGAWLLLARPLLDHLSKRGRRRATAGRLAGKIASRPGFAELTLLDRGDGLWHPLATGTLTLAQIAAADGWLALPASSEGLAAEAGISIEWLREEP